MLTTPLVICIAFLAFGCGYAVRAWQTNRPQIATTATDLSAHLNGIPDAVLVLAAGNYLTPRYTNLAAQKLLETTPTLCRDHLLEHMNSLLLIDTSAPDFLWTTKCKIENRHFHMSVTVQQSEGREKTLLFMLRDQSNVIQVADGFEQHILAGASELQTSTQKLHAISEKMNAASEDNKHLISDIAAFSSASNMALQQAMTHATKLNTLLAKAGSRAEPFNLQPYETLANETKAALERAYSRLTTLFDRAQHVAGSVGRTAETAHDIKEIAERVSKQAKLMSEEAETFYVSVRVL